MYLHLGNDVSVRHGDIVGVFDLDNSSQSKITRDFLYNGEDAGLVKDISGELPKAFVVCGDGSIYLSQLSSSTLLKRFGTFFENPAQGE